MEIKTISKKIRGFSPLLLLGLCGIYSFYVIGFIYEIISSSKKPLSIRAADISSVFHELVVLMGFFLVFIYPLLVVLSLYVILKKLKSIEKNLDIQEL